MTTAMAKIAVLVLVLAVAAGTGYGACNYTFQVKTGYLGTDGFIDFGLYQDGADAGWGSYRVDAGLGAYRSGDIDTFSTVSHLCIDPCGLLLEFRMRILGLQPQWYCEWVNDTVSSDGGVLLARSHQKLLRVERFFNIVFPRANISDCS